MNLGYALETDLKRSGFASGLECGGKRKDYIRMLPLLWSMWIYSV